MARWLVRTVVVVLVLAAAGFAALVWRPMTTIDAVTRARLWVAGVRDGTAQVGSYRLHYLVAGSGRPVVLLHGFGLSGLSWQPYIPALTEDGARVYAPDLLGFGRSDRPDVDYSMPLETEVVRGLLDSLHVRQADLVGLSMGGAIAANFARLYPDRVRRIVLLDAAGMTVAPGGPATFLPRHPEDLARLTRLVSAGRRKVPALLAPGFVREMQRVAAVGGRFMQNKKLGTGSVDGKLSTVTVPVLLVWGALDQLTPLAAGQEYHRQLPQSELVVLENCGHTAALDSCRSHVLPEVRAFLSAAKPAQGGTRTVVVPW